MWLPNRFYTKKTAPLGNMALYVRICVPAVEVYCVCTVNISVALMLCRQYIPVTFIKRATHLVFNAFKILIAKIISLFMLGFKESSCPH